MLPVSKNNTHYAFAALFAVVTGIFPGRAGTLSSDLTSAMAAQPNVRQRVIVQTVGRPSSADGLLPSRLGGRVLTVFSRLNGYVAELPAAAVTRLGRTPGVRHISRDLPVTATFRKLPPGGYAGPWDHAARSAGADNVWFAPLGTDGAGVAVAVLDTGIAPTADVHLMGFVDLVNRRLSPYDDNGHGTHVAGIVAGRGSASGGLSGRFLGTAPGASIVSVKVLDRHAAGLASTVIQGIDWCIANKAAYRIGVINLSLGQSPRESATTDPLCRASERAVAAGITVVTAAGNNGDGYGGITSPANDPAVITVGAMKTSGTAYRSDDAIASYSSRGPTVTDHYAKPDVMAPGNRVVSLRAPGSTLDAAFPGNRVAPWAYGAANVDGARYFVLSGTSMAAPVVSGAAALILSLQPTLSPNAVKAALMASAQQVGGFDPVLGKNVERYDWMTQGAGYVNAAGAVRLASYFSTAPSGDVTLPDGWGADVIQGESVLWSNSVLWGNQAVQAGDYSAFLAVRWDRSVLWGDAFLWTTGLVPGEDAVSSTSVLWGNHPSIRLAPQGIIATGD